MLEITVFLCGALVMILEMTGARVLAPHVGTSAIVWTSLIGVVLACLAAGAWAGGRFADKKLSNSGLAKALTGAGAGVMITAFGHAAIGSGITAHIPNLYAAAVLAAICIFAMPAFFFGMITPYVIRLRIASVDTAGATVGRLYALSTAGSILGTFLGGFALISWLSSSTILWGLAVAMFLISLVNYPQHPWFRLILIAASIFLAWQDKAYAEWQASQGAPRLLESPYNSIRIMEGKDNSLGGKSVRLMATDPGYSQSGMRLDDPNELYFNYTRYYALGPALVPNAKKALMLGGGGYSVPKWLLAGKSAIKNPESLELTVVELDPQMTKAAQEYFALKPDKRLKILHEDARAFLNRQQEEFDLVFVDVFNSHYSIPFHMGTREAIQELAKSVAPDGVMLMNVISAIEGEDGRLFRSIWQNIREFFPYAKVYCVSSPTRADQIQNLMIVASKKDLAFSVLMPGEKASPTPEEMTAMSNQLYKSEIKKDVEPLGDDYAPVERYTLMLTRDESR